MIDSEVHINFSNMGAYSDVYRLTTPPLYGPVIEEADNGLVSYPEQHKLLNEYHQVMRGFENSEEITQRKRLTDNGMIQVFSPVVMFGGAERTWGMSVSKSLGDPGQVSLTIVTMDEAQLMEEVKYSIRPGGFVFNQGENSMAYHPRKRNLHDLSRAAALLSEAFRR